MPKPKERKRIVPQGDLIESCTIGAMVVIRTTVQIYVVHMSWIPELPGPVAEHARELYARGWHTLPELAQLFGTSVTSMTDCVTGRAYRSTKVYRKFLAVQKGSAPVY